MNSGPDASMSTSDATSGDGAGSAHTVTLSVVGDAAQLVEYRDGSGAWQAATGTGPDYQLHVTNDYQVMIVCEDFASELALAAADGPTYVYACPVDKRPTVNVTGFVKQAGDVWFGNSVGDYGGPTQFQLFAMAGTHDMLAYDLAMTHAVMKHDIVVGTQNIDLGDIDIDAGSALGTLPITLNNELPNDLVFMSTGVTTGNGDTFVVGQADTLPQVHPLPASVLAAKDRRFLEVSASSETSDRDVTYDHFDPTSQHQVTLPDPIAGVTFSFTPTQYVAKWTALPDSDWIRLDVSEGITQVSLNASRGYLAAHPGVTQLAFDPTVPGMQSKWILDTTGQTRGSLTVTKTMGNVTTRITAH